MIKDRFFFFFLLKKAVMEQNKEKTQCCVWVCLCVDVMSWKRFDESRDFLSLVISSHGY